MLISSTSNRSDLNILLNACEEYMLDKVTARHIVNEVVKAVGGWRKIANCLQIPPSEINKFSSRFERYVNPII